MSRERPASRRTLIVLGAMLVMGSLLLIPLSMAYDLVFVDWPMWQRLSVFVVVTSVLAAPTLILYSRRWRLAVWMAALGACVILANVPWSREKGFYLAAERVPIGATVDQVQERMGDYVLQTPERLASAARGQGATDLYYGWYPRPGSAMDGAVFTFERGHVVRVQRTPD